VVDQRPLKNQLFEVRIYTGTIQTGKCMSNFVRPTTAPNMRARRRLNFSELNNAAKSVQEDILQTESNLSQVLFKLKSYHLQNPRLQGQQGKNKASVLLGNLENQSAPLSPNSVLVASHPFFSSPPQRDSAHLCYSDLLTQVFLASGQY